VLLGRGAAAAETAWLQIDSTLGSRGSSSFVRILP
jgi:hypothetical protein